MVRMPTAMTTPRNTSRPMRRPVRMAASLGIGGAAHHARLGLVDAEGHGRRAVGDEVHPQHLDGAERHGQAEQRRPEDGADGAHVRGQLEPHELDDVVVDGAAPLDGADDGGEVVVGEHHVAGFLGDLGAGDAHGHADVGPAQRRGVVHAVAGHGHDVAPALERLDDPHLVLGRHPGAHADAVDLLGELLVGHRGRARRR